MRDDMGAGPDPILTMMFVALLILAIGAGMILIARDAKQETTTERPLNQ
jgi:hypothetical protein